MQQAILIWIVVCIIILASAVVHAIYAMRHGAYMETLSTVAVVHAVYAMRHGAYMETLDTVALNGVWVNGRWCMGDSRYTVFTVSVSMETPGGHYACS